MTPHRDGSDEGSQHVCLSSIIKNYSPLLSSNTPSYLELCEHKDNVFIQTVSAFGSSADDQKAVSARNKCTRVTSQSGLSLYKI